VTEDVLESWVNFSINEIQFSGGVCAFEVNLISNFVEELWGLDGNCGEDGSHDEED